VSAKQWLLLDYGGVIGCPPTAADWEALRRATGWADAGELARAYWAPRVTYDLGELSPDQYWQRVLAPQQALRPTHLQHLIELDTGMWLRPDTRVLQKIRRARGRGLGVALLSNMPRPIARVIDATPWAWPCTPRLYSCDLHTAKPSTDAFSTALDRLQADPDQVVFVDDHSENVAAAQRLGIPSLLYDGHETIDRATSRLA
jgi:putative hydrolase of the HAD superfamily